MPEILKGSTFDLEKALMVILCEVCQLQFQKCADCQGLKHGNRISCAWLSGPHTAETPFVFKLGSFNTEPLDKQFPPSLLL